MRQKIEEIIRGVLREKLDLQGADFRLKQKDAERKKHRQEIGLEEPDAPRKPKFKSRFAPKEKQEDNET